MGSHSTDYDLITDTRKRKYKDDESIVDGAVDDFATVTLGNGGSYQKKYPNRDLNDKENVFLDSDNDLYDANLENDDPRRVVKRNPENGEALEGKYESKYYKNKHFFMDPFALTISQWCYVHLPTWKSQDSTWRSKPYTYGWTFDEAGWKSENPRRVDETPEQYAQRVELAREQSKQDYIFSVKSEIVKSHLKDEVGANNYAQMARSYWRYVCIWGEPGEWEKWKQEYVSSRNVTFRNDDDIVSIDDDDVVEVRAVDDSSEEVASNESSGGSTTSAPIGTPPTEEDQAVIDFLCQRGYYNPLDDTRPYYYATYDDVRGTGQVYVDRGVTTQYIIYGNKKDEFQMNTRITTNPVSFMDILNNKVVFQTQKRIYGAGNPDTVENYVSAIEREMARGKTLDEAVNTIKGAEYDSLGESPLMPFLMIARDNKLGVSPSDR